MKLKKGDLVKVVLGKDKGKQAKIEKILPKIDKVLVTGVNQYKRHLKARAQGQSSEIVTITKPLSSSVNKPASPFFTAKAKSCLNLSSR